MTQVKICGVQDPLHAEAAAHAGADAIGLVFAPSKRQVSIEKARDISSAVPKHVKKVGVFVNTDPEELVRIKEEVGLDFVQLHGDETPEFCRHLSIPYIKALSITTEQDLKKLEQYEADYMLLDSGNGPARGGNGTTFDWSLLKQISIDPSQFILAGGLHEENVQEAIEQTNPTMVDVSSGVETNSVKDPKKIKQFIERVKERS
ncbi:phosphoribosylanthranilate isomerase [Aquisalibacillus elongatus]|uniref:N-(5'-phosphoribosyl)anthranilate isomerase n=1 Tax=Aquisalibacillus elongatus TaxID=485577 RepID=A0A3N5BU07_9BACI|nr:phosphoribosylanthranilate isomerase [Aquisalibacillus elongatus]RPF53268.1 phosphoribosylanthranilate isomerase [Aquisalibacillus elongatus]